MPRSSAALAAAAVALAVSSTSPASAAVGDSFVNKQIKGRGKLLGKCLEVPEKIEDGATVYFADCDIKQERQAFSLSAMGQMMPKSDPTKCMDAHTPKDNGDVSLQLYSCWDDDKHHRIFNFLYTGTVSKSGHPQFAGQIQSKFVDALDSCFKPFANLGGPTEIHMGKCDPDNKEMMFTIWDYKSKTGAKTSNGAESASASASASASVSASSSVSASASTSDSGSTASSSTAPGSAASGSAASGSAASGSATAGHPPMAKESGIDFAQRLEERAAKDIVSAVQKTTNGCTCKTSWEIGANALTYPNNCADPDNMMGFNWCFTEEKDHCAGVDGHHHWDRCEALGQADAAPSGSTATQLDCKCKDRWESNGRVFKYPNNCGDPEHLLGKDWCYTEPGCTDSGGKAKAWDFCVRDEDKIKKNIDTVTARAESAKLQKMGEFETQTKTKKGCACEVWKNFKEYTEPHNQCGKDKGKGPWCMVVDVKCEGDTFGFCEKTAAPTTAKPSGAMGAEPAVKPQSAALRASTSASASGSNNLAPPPEKIRCEHGGVQGPVCLCNDGFAGQACDRCAAGFEGYPNCLKSACGCMAGSCNKDTKKCDCPSNYGGDKCEVCATGFGGPKCFPMSTIQGNVLAMAKGKGRHHYLLMVFGGVALLVFASIVWNRCCKANDINDRWSSRLSSPNKRGGYRAGKGKLPEL